jgi:hypothetical protein
MLLRVMYSCSERGIFLLGHLKGRVRAQIRRRYLPRAMREIMIWAFMRMRLSMCVRLSKMRLVRSVGSAYHEPSGIVWILFYDMRK